MSAELFDQFHCGFDRSPGCQQIIHNKDALARTYGIGVHLNDVRPIFQGILHAYCLRGQLAKFAYWHKTAVEQIGQWRTKNKASRLHANDRLDTCTCVMRGETVERSPESRTIL